MSESRYYRDNLADILEFTEGRHLLSLEDVRRFTGIKKYSTLKNRFPFNGSKICLEPTIPTSAFVTAQTGPHPCQVVSINERHHHFTVEFDFPEGSFRETYKEE